MREEDVAVLASPAIRLVDFVVRILERTVAAGRRVAVEVNDAERAAVGIGERNTARAEALAEGYVVVAHERLAHTVRHAAGRLEVGARATNEPLQLERGIGFEHIILRYCELQEQVRECVTAQTSATTGAVVVIVRDEIRAS